MWHAAFVCEDVRTAVARLGKRTCAGAAVVALALVLCISRPARAVEVGAESACSETALRAAIAQLAPERGSLAVECLTDLSVTSPITVTDGVSLSISGPVQLTSSGNRLFAVEPAAALTLRGLTLTGAHVTGNGGAILSAGRLTLADVRLIDNSAARGGAISVGDGATLTVVASVFMQNAASVEGGALYLAGSANLTDTTWSENNAPNAGAIRVLPGEHANLEECLIHDGTSATAPAFHNSGETDLRRCIMTNMSTTVDYGAVDNDGLLRVTNTIFLDNKSPDANSLHNHTVTPVNVSRMELTYVTMLGRAPGGLADVINNGDLTMRNLVINGAARYTCYQGEEVADPPPSFVSRGGNVLSDRNDIPDRGCFFAHSTLMDHFGGAPLSVADDSMGMVLVFPTIESPAIGGAACMNDIRFDLRGVERGLNKGCDSGAVETRPGETFFRNYLPAVKRH